MSLKEKAFKLTPFVVQDTAITLFNTYQYKIRHGGNYRRFRDYYARVESLTESEISKEVEIKKNNFFKYVKNNSKWYKDFNFDNFSLLPILEKEDLINNLNDIKTINEKDGLVNLTGGTTGASMKVIYTKSDMQERFAILDHFRSQHGYELGKKTAWFSGKNLISEVDINKGICSHYDFINRIRFYSTFHINSTNFDIYWKSLNKFAPEFIVGFPSSVYEICRLAETKGLTLNNKVNTFFPTSETVLSEHRTVISRVLGCKVIDQYASSEGAPFILECTSGSLHLHPLTGIFEVVDENIQPAQEGEMIVTSFTTHGTPLIRYRVKDRIKLASNEYRCLCGSTFPLVEKIEGRATDYLLSPTHGKVNLVNISNSTKGIKGIIKFQIIQKDMNSVDLLVVGNQLFDLAQQNQLCAALNERLGDDVQINVKLVDDIPNEKSGKFRIVKNLLEL